MDNLVYLLEPNFQVLDDNGKPLVGGWIEVYLHNTTTKVITYCDFEGTQNEFKVVLNSLGMANIIVEADNLYDVYCYDSFGALRWSRMNVSKVDLFPLKVYTEGDLENPVAEYDPTEGQGEGFVQKKLTIKVNGQTQSEYVPFAEEGEEVDIHSESIEWDAVSHSINKDVNGTKETIVEVEITYSPTSEKPISGKGVADGKFVSVNPQSWSDAQKEQARLNIQAIMGMVLNEHLPFYTERLMSLYLNSSNDIITIYGDNGHSFSLIKQVDGSDYGKVPFVSPVDPNDEGVPQAAHHFSMRFILENCATNSDVLKALQRGQIPSFNHSSGIYIPYFVDSSGVMYVNNVFGVSDNNPMTGDALGKSLRRTIYNGNVNAECLWGKPYGLNYIEVAECKCNNDYHLGLGNETIMAWRRIPMDREMVITAFSLIGKTASVKKAMMVGIFDFDGENVTNVSASSTWTENSGYYYNDMENALRLQDIITSGSGAYPFVTFSLSEPLTLQAGKNYLFPCRFNDDNTYNDPWVYTYKRAVPAMPWEELVRNTTENGDPVMSTAKAGCKPSALMLTLSDGTAMWI